MLAPALGTARGGKGEGGAERARARESAVTQGRRGSAECAPARPVGASWWGRKEAEGARRVHSQRTNESRVLRDLGSLGTPGCLRDDPGWGWGISPGKEDGSGARTKWLRRLSRPSPTRARCVSLSLAGCGLQASRTPGVCA